MMLRTVVFIAVMVVVGASWTGAATAADRLSCQSASAVECRNSACERQELHSDLTVDLGRKSVRYCAGAGCFDAAVALVKAEDGSVSFVFDATSEQGPRGGRVDRLVTLHPEGKTATIGTFLADGAVVFSPMECRALPPARVDRTIASIPFAVGQYKPDQSGLAALTKAIAWLKAHPNGQVTLAGHADDPGSDDYNLALGDKRAAVVRAAMVAQGIAADRLTAITFGRFRPLPPGGGHNGRVEIVLGE